MSPEKIIVKGRTLDEHTRCVHYHSEWDIIAVKFKCCGAYYPCYECHSKEAKHPAKRWSKNEFQTKAILCGNCGNELTILQYLNSGNECPFCHSPFNPNCSKHEHLYFEIE